MVDGAAVMLTPFFQARASGFWGERGTNHLDTGAHFYETYETSDGKLVAVGTVEGKFYAELMERLGLEYDVSTQYDKARWPEEKERLAAVFRTKTRDEWRELLEGTDACFAPVLSPLEAPEHPHNRERRTFLTPAGSRSRRRRRGFAGQPQPSPAAEHPGADTETVLGALGLRSRRGGEAAGRGRGAVESRHAHPGTARPRGRPRRHRRMAGREAPARDVDVSPISGPSFTGFSNETLIFDATWDENGKTRTEGYVIRVKPTAHTIFLESDFDSQYKVMKALSDGTDVPLPPVHWFEDDESVLGAPFFVMGKVDGRVPADNPPYTQQGWMKEEASPAERERIVMTGLEAMARIHQADWRALGLESLSKPQYGAPGFDQQLAYYEKSFEWAAEGRPQPIAEATLEWVRANRPMGNEHLALAWGDARINNQMFDDEGTASRCSTGRWSPSPTP